MSKQRRKSPVLARKRVLSRSFDIVKWLALAVRMLTKNVGIAQPCSTISVVTIIHCFATKLHSLHSLKIMALHIDLKAILEFRK